MLSGEPEHWELVFELEQQARGGLLADAADGFEARLVAARHAVREFVGAQIRQHGQRELRPDARHAEQNAKRHAIVGAGKAVERQRLFAHVRVHVQGRRRRHRQASQRTQGHEHFVAHAAHVEHTTAVLALVDDDA